MKKRKSEGNQEGQREQKKMEGAGGKPDKATRRQSQRSVWPQAGYRGSECGLLLSFHLEADWGARKAAQAKRGYGWGDKLSLVWCVFCVW